MAEGVITNKQVVEELANSVADRVVNKILTVQPVLSDATPAMKTVRSPGFEPGLPAWRADVLDQTLRAPGCEDPETRSGRRPHRPASATMSF